MSGLTKQEVYEFLSGYPQAEQTIPMVLGRLGYDESTEEYPADVVEKAEKIYESMGLAVETHKQLQASMGTEMPQDSQIIVQQVGAIAFQLLEQQGISLPMEIIAAVAQAKVMESIGLADRLSEVQERAFANRLAQNQAVFARKLLNLSDRASDNLEAILGDEAQSEIIGAAMPLPPVQVDVAAFMSSVDARKKAQLESSQKHTEAVAALPPKDPKAFLKAFLAARP